MTMYHRENAQEGFLVLAGECVLVVEGEERPLRPWDYFHCPPGVSHAIVGAGTEPSLVLAVGARTEESRGSVVFPSDPVALRHGAGVETETSDPREAYAPFSLHDCAYREGWLPG
jgi:quercetin dioxygenase-like cupin family protein